MKQGWTVIRSKEKFRSESVNKVQGSLRIILWWSSDISKSGRIGSSKNLSLHTKIEKSSKNCQKQLCQNSRKQSKIYSHQVSTESKKKKKQLKEGRKVLWHFYLSLPHSLPSSVMVLKITGCITNVESQSLVPEGAEWSISAENCVFLFNLFGDHWRTNSRACLCFT